MSEKAREAKKGQGRFTEGKEFVNETPEGQLKDFSQPMADSYHPKVVEASWDTYWDQSGFFTADNKSEKETYVMVIPPPNVTGTLHLGHALTISVEDCVIRWNRMCGKEALWVPGVDHAGIATQVVVEKKLMRERKITRHHLGREAFLEEVWAWKNQNTDRIRQQIRRMGSSVDWSRERFTMDEVCGKAVVEAFCLMRESGKIYRANRLVSWSCKLQTAISAIEVDHMEVKGPKQIRVPGYEDPVEVGVIHSFAYKIKGEEGEIVVATTRVETMLGDTAVAVHPDDPRYQHLIGKELVHPFIEDRLVVVVPDPILVDMAFGTGAVKVTPGHDPNDFACGRRNNLPMINILNDDGTINANGGSYEGTPRFTARKQMIQAFKDLGLYRGVADNPMSIGLCSRSKDLIEPVLRPQWWVNTTQMAARAVAAVREGELQIIPEANKSVWYHFLEDADELQQQWCISRQLWWGHRIPAWFPIVPDTELDELDDSNWIVARSFEEAKKIATERFPTHTELRQDPDVLDTWFSSGLFPFSVFNWPDENPDLAKFFPGHLLETGKDILFFWVARMVMMSLDLTNQLPFTTVFLHAMVRDRMGRKMSKSLGNVVDPISVIEGISLEKLNNTLRNGNLDPREVERAIKGQQMEFPDGIAECGTDALRFGLLSYTGEASKDIKLDINVVVSKREFCNKLWNVTKFCLQNFDEKFQRPADKAAIDAAVTAGSQFRDRWILDRLAHCVTTVNDCFTNFRFAEACEAVHTFWLHELCANYVEMIKPVMRGEDGPAKEAARTTLYTCMSYGLRLLHPIMPFVTEELFHRLPNWTEEVGPICVAAFPCAADVAGWANEQMVSRMAILLDCARSARSTRASLGLTKKKLDLFVVCGTDEMFSFANDLQEDLRLLTKSAVVVPVNSDGKRPDGCMVTLINEDLELHFPVVGLAELSKEVLKREKKLTKLNSLNAGLRAKITAPGFAQSSAQVQEKLTNKLALQEAEAKTLSDSVELFLSIMTADQKQGYWAAKVTSVEGDIKKAQKQFAKCEKNMKKNPKNKKNIKLHTEVMAQIQTLEKQLAFVTAQRDATNDATN